MNHAVGIAASGRIAVALVENGELISPVSAYPPSEDDIGDLHSMPIGEFVETIARLIDDVCRTQKASPAAVGIGFPGIIRDGIIDESPNLKQVKGENLGARIKAALAQKGMTPKLSVYNDADATAAGIAARSGQLEKLVRVWTLGQGIGFGRYPHPEGPGEGGHFVVTLDPKEVYCGCGGRGHLEGIMGHRAMRLRFLDLEPEEVFANARKGDPRCSEFASLWHRALAAATATAIHLEGPGKFFIAGPNSRFIRLGLLSDYLHEMVAMSPLQGSVFEIAPDGDEIAIIGAAINALRG